MVIHGEGREGGVLPVIASQRGRSGGGPEVTGAFTWDKENEREKGIDRQGERLREAMRCAEHRRRHCTVRVLQRNPAQGRSKKH